MITYKGNPLVKGKHFIYEGQKVEYQGKAYGDKHIFKQLDETEIILEEQDALNLKTLVEQDLLAEQDNSEDLYQIVTSYIDKQINILRNSASNKMWNELLTSLNEEIATLTNLGLAYQPNYKPISDDDKNYLMEFILDYLEGHQRNISEINIPSYFDQINNFVYNIEKTVGDV